MEDQPREVVRQLLERARSDWRGIEFVVYVHPDRLEMLADPTTGDVSDDDPTLRTFMGADLRAWDTAMNNPPAIDEVHVSPFYGRVLPEGIPAYFVSLGVEPPL
ncbi:hypothetical protein KXS11_12005 [Plantibacter flavus]|uniref:hypothetical protein n=1 Tax=Plantibacter flavus TaxID=150123 RepID=UPI003F18152A